MAERIQKVLAAAGLGSRRSIEQMVVEGRITVNGDTVTSLPCFVEPSDQIQVDGQAVRKRAERPTYILLNKPRGVICTQRDELGRNRPRAVDLVGGVRERIYCVGRLDAEATGLILMTNDGDLTNRLTHPRYGMAKTYVARVEGKVMPETVAALRRGVFLEGRRSPGAEAKILSAAHAESMLEIRISEGRNPQVRRMLARLGHKVKRLHRPALGPITDRGLKIGHFRPLTADEVEALRKLSRSGRTAGDTERQRNRAETANSEYRTRKSE